VCSSEKHRIWSIVEFTKVSDLGCSLQGVSLKIPAPGAHTIPSTASDVIKMSLHLYTNTKKVSQTSISNQQPNQTRSHSAKAVSKTERYEIKPDVFFPGRAPMLDNASVEI
jgi:hypothetical protein